MSVVGINTDSDLPLDAGIDVGKRKLQGQEEIILLHDGDYDDTSGVSLIPSSSWWRPKANPYLALPAFLIFFIAMYIAGPTYTFIVEKLLCDADSSTSTIPCVRRKSIQSQVSYWTGWLTLTKAGCTALAAGSLGSLSDRFGRVWLLRLSSAGQLFNACNVFVVIYWKLNFRLLFVGELINGLSSGYIGFLAASFAYAADTTDKAQRTAVFGTYEACIFFGGGVGPLAAGQLSQRYGPTWAAATMCGMTFLVLVYTVWLPESLGPSKRVARPLSLLKTNVFTTLLFLFTRGRQQGHPPTALCGGRQGITGPTAMVVYTFALSFLALLGFYGIVILYIQLSPFDFSESDIGYYFAGGSIVRALGIVGGSWLFFHGPSCLRFREVIVIRMSTFVAIAMYACMALAPTTPYLLAASALTIASGLTVPVARSVISKSCVGTDQGEALTAIASVEALTSTFAAPLFGVIYHKTVGIYSQWSFWVMTGLVTVAFFFSCLIPISFPPTPAVDAGGEEGQGLLTDGHDDVT